MLKSHCLRSPDAVALPSSGRVRTNKNDSGVAGKLRSSGPAELMQGPAGFHPQGHKVNILSGSSEQGSHGPKKLKLTEGRVLFPSPISATAWLSLFSGLLVWCLSHMLFLILRLLPLSLLNSRAQAVGTDGVAAGREKRSPTVSFLQTKC